jgi:hypothetical protein
MQSGTKWQCFGGFCAIGPLAHLLRLAANLPLFYKGKLESPWHKPCSLCHVVFAARTLPYRVKVSAKPRNRSTFSFASLYLGSIPPYDALYLELSPADSR